MGTHGFTQDQLVGHWRYADKFYGCDWILQEDGTFTGSVTRGGILVSRQTGRWIIEGDQLVCSSIRDEFNMLGSSTDRDLLLEVTEQFFIIKTRQGIRRRYERIDQAKTHAA
jgi:hypothetical protein